MPWNFPLTRWPKKSSSPRPIRGFYVRLFLTEDCQNFAYVPVLLESGAVTEEVVHVHYEGPLAPETLCSVAPTHSGWSTSGVGVRRPCVIADFMTRMRTDDEPCSPNGMTFHSNCPS